MLHYTTRKSQVRDKWIKIPRRRPHILTGPARDSLRASGQDVHQEWDFLQKDHKLITTVVKLVLK